MCNHCTSIAVPSGEMGNNLSSAVMTIFTKAIFLPKINAERERKPKGIEGNYGTLTHVYVANIR